MTNSNGEVIPRRSYSSSYNNYFINPTKAMSEITNSGSNEYFEVEDDGTFTE